MSLSFLGTYLEDHPAQCALLLLLHGSDFPDLLDRVRDVAVADHLAEFLLNDHRPGQQRTTRLLVVPAAAAAAAAPDCFLYLEALERKYQNKLLSS